ncbi:MAG: SDR family NAD(P)-dependent oxidoreductase, partial [Gemmatimonadetes bacterium]|nr:SDR family NAD(P)-dependent oxidoreductase [Gemmatimonadota bacterium]
MSIETSPRASEKAAGRSGERAKMNAVHEQSIAIIGMACRFPGAPDLDSFWNLLEAGGNAVTEGVPGSGTGRIGTLFPEGAVISDGCRYGAFVDDIDQFDESFFRISPVEAQLLDPQQRMTLETSWQALEDAGIDPDSLKGSRTGVYTGISNDEYRMLVLESTRPSDAASCLYALSGTNLNGTCGRVAFVLGLMGPVKAVDAACASSLVSIHDAVSDLQHGKADLALAGGVQALLNPRIYELRADSMMLSPDGQCKTFDASANGYVRGEGCGVVVLKRLSEAEADGDRIWGVIRGSAINHGGASTGLTVPHTPALIRVIEDALDQAQISPTDVEYLEAHGTGTTVGDPIEIDAVSEVYCRGRDADQPLLTGSVKTNLGHLESAAGVAGLIKAALVVKHGVIPKHLHFHDPNPGIDWDNLPIRVTTEMMDWPRTNGRTRMAGVNSFGISGTNAHIVVEEYRAPDEAGESGREVAGSPVAGSPIAVAASLPESMTGAAVPSDDLGPRKTRLLPLSGKSDDALRELAGRYLSWLDQQTERTGLAEESHSGDGDGDGEAGLEGSLSDMAWTSGVGRSHFDHRAGIAFHDIGSLRERLTELTETGPIEHAPKPEKVAFVYTGQGSQWVGMGQALYEQEPVARAVLDRCEAVFQEVRGTSLLDVMFGRNEAEGPLNDTAWEQPALFALECALTALWSSIGVRPAVVMGHSVGELAAAHAAGVFSLEDGMRFAAARGTLLSGTEEGAMAAVFAPAERVATELEGLNGAAGDDEAAGGTGCNISADNGSHQVVSGPVPGIEAVMRHFESAGIRARRLNTTRAFHSALVEPALNALEASLDGVTVNAPSIAVVSNLTGQAVAPEHAFDGAYWKRHAREPVAFAQSVGTLAALGVDLVVEIGPHAILAPMTVSSWPESPQTPAPKVLPSLTRPSNDSPVANVGSLVNAVAAAYEAGLPIRFDGLYAGESRRRIALPGYPFQRQRHWVEAPKQRRSGAGHPLLGDRHESARGEITFETEIFPADPSWLNDHRVFNRVLAPGALYGSMACAVSMLEGSGPMVLEDMQLHNAMVFEDEEGAENGRRIQVVIDTAKPDASRGLQIYSKGNEEEWTVHVEGRIVSGASDPGDGQSGQADQAGQSGQVDRQVDLETLKDGLSPVDVAGYYRHRASTGVDLGPSFRTLGNAWSRPGEAVAEVSITEPHDRDGLDVHPLVLDGCFQVMGVARNVAETEGGATYLPFGWERMWLAGPLPDRVVCHVLLGESSRGAEANPDETPEVLSGEMRIYDPNGALVGRLSGYTVKRATRAALLAAVEGVNDLLYEVVWRERPLAPGIEAADFFPRPSEIADNAQSFTGYLTDAGVDPENRNALLADLERWSRSRALASLEELGWQREKGAVVDPDDLRQALGVLPEHTRLFRRLFEMLARSGVMEEQNDGFRVVVGPEDPLPEHMPADLEAFAGWMKDRYDQGQIEIGLFLRSGLALAEVLRGKEDPLTLLFSSGEPTAGDLYLKAPVARAANRMLTEAVQALVSTLPDGRRLRVIEVGAGTGSATASVLPELPEGRFIYTYTDISAGFFSEAEARFGDRGGAIDYRPLDIEKDPIEQGFEPHGYDLLIASNVLHATRYLTETLGHCRDLLAPSGHLIALENLSGLGWMDLTFGQLDGWWRFADDYRPHHALAGPDVWKQALGDAGFAEAEVLGPDEPDGPDGTGAPDGPGGPDTSSASTILDKGVIVAQGPAKVSEPAGTWILTEDRAGRAAELASALAERNQTVYLVRDSNAADGLPAATGPGIVRTTTEWGHRESWRSLIEGLPQDVPFGGVVHLAGLDGPGAQAATVELAAEVQRAGASALALVQGLIDTDSTPARGVWFITRGSQVLERELGGELAGAALWGFGKGVAREAPHLQPRMLDLDPAELAPDPDLVNEFMYPDEENHIVYRREGRMVARLVRMGDGADRLDFPEDQEWVLAPDPAGVFDQPFVQPLPPRPLEPREVRVAVEAAGLNFWDVFRSLGFIEEGLLGREMCGVITEVGDEVSSVSVGDHVVGLGFGAFAPLMITHADLVAPAPEGFSVSGLATVPSAFVSAALSFEYSGLEAGEKVLIHAGAGGVGLAAIQLVQAAGAEVHATASAPKQAYLRSLGVEHIYDSRTTAFGPEILEATDGEGVDVVLNSLTGEGFIDASLSCLKPDGRFVEMARRDILTGDEMAALRPDVAYDILELDVLKKTDPAWVGRVLRGIMARLVSGELKPIIHSRWPLAEAGAALSFMRSARHLGKIVVTPPPLVTGRLKKDRTYLVTGGLGGIGCAVAGWLADRGAGTIVLNGRRQPDAEAEEAIQELRERGVAVQVELADVTDLDAVDAMLERMDRELPPLGGVIHSVGVLSDGALGNQRWENFETVLRPKILGAWHLHQATRDRDLDLFVLFSSRVGVMGNPGQANHAMANAFLDQLAGHRRALGLPGQAIAWGAWSEIGEAAEQKDRIESQRAALGGRWFTPQQGLRALDRLVRQDGTHSVVMAMDWAVFEEAAESRPPLLEDLLAAAQEAAEEAPESSSDDVLTRLRNTPSAERENVLVSFLQGEVQSVLRLSSTPAPTVGFFDLGMDSLMAVELRNRLNRALAGSYTAPNTLVFDYPDISSLATHLMDEIGDSELESGDPESDGGDGSEAAGSEAHSGSGRFAIASPDAPARQESSATAAPTAPTEPASGASATPEAPTGPASDAVSRTENEGIAIIGMACRFPGAPDLNAFWSMLEKGTDAVADMRPDTGPANVSPDRPDQDGPDQDGEGWRRTGFIEGIDRFDARFFRVSPLEARSMDPQQRLLLETSWHAIDDAGINPDGLRGSRTGVYTGIASSEYRDLMQSRGGGVNFLGTARSLAVSRISFLLGLEGPSVPMELNCASALFAVHQAVASLRLGEVDLALAGGVNTVLSPDITAEMAYLGMLSNQGRCYAFDAKADGFVRGEGCGVVVLKRLTEAQADGDRIWGVIRGTATNQNGATAGPTVPNGPAQERVIEDALAQADIDPAEVDYLEAHGAGSALGDSIEVQAAAAVYGRGRAPDQPLLVGSVKTNIGHLESAAGLAGLIKVVMAIRHRRIPKQLHFEKPNPNVEWDRLPVRVASEAVHWPAHPDRPHRAAVSAFGISGANAHVVVEGYETCDDGAQPAETGVEAAGTRQTVAVKLPPGVPEPQRDSARPGSRTNRLLPLSGKNPAALRDLAGSYLSWLDRSLAEDSNAESEAEFLADIAWTASAGRSHFNCRNAVVFRDVAMLREGLEALASNEARSDAEDSNWINVAAATPKVAFVYDGWNSGWRDIGKRLYDSEPVVCGILDHCEALFRGETDASLLDPLFEGEGTEHPFNDPAWTDPAAYALQCAITAMWSSLNIRPSAVCGRSTGEIAAAQATGAFTLDQGLRIALARGETLRTMDEARDAKATAAASKTRLDGISVSTPSLTIVSGATGEKVGSAEMTDLAGWLYRTLEGGGSLDGKGSGQESGGGKGSGASARSLADLAVDTLIEIGPISRFAAGITEAWPEKPADEAASAPTLFGSLAHAEDEIAEEEGDGFLQAVKTAYD